MRQARRKKPAPALLAWAEQPALVDELGGSAARVACVLRALMVAGAKSLTHTISMLERYHAPLEQLIAAAGPQVLHASDISERQFSDTLCLCRTGAAECCHRPRGVSVPPNVAASINSTAFTLCLELGIMRPHRCARSRPGAACCVLQLETVPTACSHGRV